MPELLTSEQMGHADSLTIFAGTPGIELMERAGVAVAQKAMEMFGEKASILVLCGPGNNGGDGFVAARWLRDHGVDVRLVLLGAREQLKGDAALAARMWTDPIRAFSTQELKRANGIIDALFGAGLTRDLTGPVAKIVTAVNTSGLPVLAVDLPSGIDGSNGQIQGVAIKATCSISFFRRKPGHVLFPGREYCGPVELVDIGIRAKVLKEIKPQTFVNDPALWRSSLPRPHLTSHKYQRGHAVVVSGGPESTGAARLAAMSALRMGAGLVTLTCPIEALAINAAQLTAIMVKPFTSKQSFALLMEDQRKNTVVIGPGAGVGDETRMRVLSLLAGNKALVIDADALTSFEPQSELLFEAINKRAAPTILTPHDGEYQRLFKHAPPKADRLTNARYAARLSGAILVLKGPDTVIAEPGGRATINDNAPPYLATAGSGDVLAGMIGGLLAQNMPLFEAACAAVWLHGDAAADFGPGLISEDLPQQLPAALNRLEQTR